MLAKSLYRWAALSEENTALIYEWLDTAVEAIAAGNGNQVLSTSANGASVSFGAGLTTATWFQTLSLAISYLDNPPVSKITGRLL